MTNDEGRPARKSTTEDRRLYLQKWVTENPRATVAQARRVVLDEFGISLGTEYIAQVVRAAKRVHDEDRRRQRHREQGGIVPDEGPILFEGEPDLAALARVLKQAGVRSLEVDGNTYVVTFARKL